jgi:hypothetical protein
MERSHTILPVVVSVFVRGALLAPAPAAADIQFVGVRNAFDAGDDVEGAGRYLLNPIDSTRAICHSRWRPTTAVPNVVTRYRDPDRVTPQYDKEQIR